MKTMTCRQLGGVCDLPFRTNTFDEIAEMSKKQELIKPPKAMKE
ncbi:MAG: hypothetical protein ACI9AV_000436 [Sediminicola sp.]|jgi:hypothetical protein